jgi:hypothetical protein
VYLQRSPFAASENRNTTLVQRGREIGRSASWAWRRSTSAAVAVRGERGSQRVDRVAVLVHRDGAALAVGGELGLQLRRDVAGAAGRGEDHNISLTAAVVV